MSEFSMNLLWRQRGTIAKFLGFSVILSLAVSALTPIRYASTAELLVVQRGIFSRDPFVASRSTEYLSQVLAQVVTSRSFLDAVRQTNPNALLDLPIEPNREKRAYNKRVKSHVVRDTGILKISVYDRNQQRAGELADTVVQTLVLHSAEYHGEGDAVSIRVLESPLTTRWPASPNILRNVLIALVAGLLAALGSLYLLPERFATLRQAQGDERSPSSSSRAEPRDLVQSHHKRLFDWHVPELEVRSEKLEVRDGESHTGHSDLQPPTPDLPSVFEHMAGRMGQ